MRALQIRVRRGGRQPVARAPVGAAVDARPSRVALFVLGGFLLVDGEPRAPGRRVEQRRGDVGVSATTTSPKPSGPAIELASAPGGVVGSLSSTCRKPRRCSGSSRRSRIWRPPSTALDDNPLPASYEVRLQAGCRRRRRGRRAGRRDCGSCRASPTFDTTGSGWTGCCPASQSCEASGWCSGALLTVAAALTVANVVRLALHARRDEIEIMQLVGAPQVYIRGPFVMEGMLQGGIGALLALAVLGAVFLALAGSYLTPLAAGRQPVVGPVPVPWACALLLLVGGMVVGCLRRAGSASRRT